MNADRVVADERPLRHQAVDHFVFLVTCAFLVAPFVAWFVLTNTGAEQTGYVIFAPFASATVLIVLLVVIEAVERRIAGDRQGWPAALWALPIACIASGLAYSAVDPGHHVWRDGLGGAAWGIVAAIIGQRRWTARVSEGARSHDAEATPDDGAGRG